MRTISRRTRRRFGLLAAAVLLLLNISYLVLPPDSAIRLAIGFNTSRVFNFLSGSAINRDAWLRRSGKYSVALRSDVGYLIKTGYGTRHRVPAQLEAFAQTGGILGDEGRSFMVVGDWTTANETDAKLLGVQVHDAIHMMMVENKVEKPMQQHARFLKYRTLQGTVDSGDEAEARKIGQKFGWELDALKFIMGMELAYKRMPHKKWYMILDDDTFLVGPSLQLFLEHLDPSKPHYIGNAVGDYKGRFAHGGSAVLLSGEAMKRLFGRPDVVAQAYLDSLSETWGDRLVATTMQKVGIYIDERYSHYFNGESPEMTRIRSDRICAPIISFHGIRKPGAMVKVGKALARVQNPLRWGDLWEKFAAYPIHYAAQEPVQRGQDHVGPTTSDDRTTMTWKGVKSAEACRNKCRADGGRCLAWTYEGASTRECHGSPWVIIGADRAEEKTSGINWPRMELLLRQCK